MEEIKGLYLIENIMSENEEKKYLKYLDKIYTSQVKNAHVIKGNHAHEFGWIFTGGLLNITHKTLDIPKWMMKLFNQTKILFNDSKHMKNENPEHCIIQTYKPGFGIGAHIDDVKFWTNWILGISLGSGTTMIFSKNNKHVSVYLPPRSAYLMEDEARYKWTHCILNKLADYVDGEIIDRKKRISLTFRNISPSILTDELKEQAKKVSKSNILKIK